MVVHRGIDQEAGHQYIKVQLTKYMICPQKTFMSPPGILHSQRSANGDHLYPQSHESLMMARQIYADPDVHSRIRRSNQTLAMLNLVFGDKFNR